MLVETVYKEVILYVLVPLFLVLCLFGIVMFVRSRVGKNETDRQKQYRSNFWSAVIGVIFGAILEALALGFSVAFIEKITLLGLEGNYEFFLGMLHVFPFVPLLFLIYACVKFVLIVYRHVWEERYFDKSEDYEERDHI